MVDVIPGDVQAVAGRRRHKVLDRRTRRKVLRVALQGDVRLDVVAAADSKVKDWDSMYEPLCCFCYQCSQHYFSDRHLKDCCFGVWARTVGMRGLSLMFTVGCCREAGVGVP